jgi:hypothetical protein
VDGLETDVKTSFSSQEGKRNETWRVDPAAWSCGGVDAKVGIGGERHLASSVVSIFNV